MHSRAGFADLDRAHDIGVLHTFAVACFAKEASDSGAILAQLLAQDFDGDETMVRVLSAEDGGRSALADFTLQRIAGNRLSYEVFASHAPNLTAARVSGKERHCHFLDKCADRSYIGPRKPGGLPGTTAVRDRFTPLEAARNG